MDNKQVIDFIKGKLNDGTITKEQIINAVNDLTSPYSGANYVATSTKPFQNEGGHSKMGISFNLSNILYIIGALIAIAGIIIFVGQNWEYLSFGIKMALTLGLSVITYVIGMFVRNKGIKPLSNVMFVVSIVSLFGTVALLASNWGIVSSPLRILLTLGIALGTYIIGIALRGEEHKTVSQVMFIISTALAPVGSYVFVHERNISIDWTVNLSIAVSWLVLYLFAYLFTKRNIVFLINVIYATWAYMILVTKVFNVANYDPIYYKWSIIILGISYISISYGRNGIETTDKVDANQKKAIQNVLYLAGALSVLGVSYTFGESFDLFYIGLLFIMFYASVFFRSTAVLLVTSGFLIAEIIKITSKYFVNSIGWPLSLIVIGFLVIGVAYATFNLNKKYIKQNSQSV